MIQIRKAIDRGYTQKPWLDSWHSFSFADYHDPHYMSFGHLRVINQDIVKPGAGFAMHSHHDMEIITYVLQGAVQHRDSMGNHTVIQAGEVQRMTAGSGVQHSEYNASESDSLELLQIWIIPETHGLAPSYQQMKIKPTKSEAGLQWIVAKQPNPDRLTIHQNVNIYRGTSFANKQIEHKIANQHKCWLQVIKGQLSVNQQILEAGDGAGITREETLLINTVSTAEFLLFELGNGDQSEVN